MGQGLGARVRTALLAGAVALVLTACWPQQGFDDGQSYASTLPTGIVPANVGSLQRAFSVDLGTPQESSASVVWAGHVFVEPGGGLRAYDAAGVDGCSGQPVTCAPQWSAAPTSTFGRPLVADGRVWVMTSDGLVAYDPNGLSGCAGSPRICTPVVTIAGAHGELIGTGAGRLFVERLTGPSGGQHTSWLDVFTTDGVLRWEAQLDTSLYPSGRSVVTDGRSVFLRIGLAGPVAAYDLRGASGCSGTPKRCSPLWIASGPGEGTHGIFQVAVRAGRVVVQDGAFISAYDAAGVTNCAGPIRVCSPTWQSDYRSVAGFALTDDQIIADYPGTVASYRFDDARCGGNALACRPEWTGATALDLGAPPTIAGTVVYVTRGKQIRAFATDRSNGCGGTPVVCRPIWTTTLPDLVNAPMVVGDTLYVTGYVMPIGPNVGVAAFRPAA